MYYMTRNLTGSTKFDISKSSRANNTNFLSNKNKYKQIPKRDYGIVSMSIAATTLGLGVLAGMRYKVSKPNEYLVRTGLGIEDISIDKQGVLWPFQKYKFINMQPTNYTFNLHAMSVEKIDFILPGVFTIGPKDDKESMIKYVRSLDISRDDTDQNHKINEIILGILEGEVRTLSSQMTIEEIFNNRKTFKEKIIDNVQKELDQVGPGGAIRFSISISQSEMDIRNTSGFSITKSKISNTKQRESSIDMSILFSEVFGFIMQILKSYRIVNKVNTSKSLDKRK